jgi:hypothetical protein
MQHLAQDEKTANHRQEMAQNIDYKTYGRAKYRLLMVLTISFHLPI